MSSLVPMCSPTSSPIYVVELLAMVFSHLDKKSLARCARVCKLWSDTALDILWHDLTDFRPLLTLLAPMTGRDKTAGGRTIQHSCEVRTSLVPWQLNNP